MRLSWPMPRRTSLMSRAHPLAQVGHFVDEADLRREQRVGHVLGELRAFGRHHEERLLGAQERLVELMQHFADFLAPHADHDAIGLDEVFDRRAFLQELGIAGHVAIAAGAFFQPGEDLAARADGHGALGDDDRVRPQMRRDAVDDRPQGRQIGGAVVALRRADGQVHDFGRRDTAAARSVVKRSRSAAWFSRTISSRPGS